MTDCQAPRHDEPTIRGDTVSGASSETDPRQGVNGHTAREDGLYPCCKHCNHDVPVRSYRRDGHATPCDDCQRKGGIP